MEKLVQELYCWEIDVESTAKNLRQFREKNHFTTQNIAELLNVSSTTVNNWEQISKNADTPKYEKLINLAELYKVKVEDLIIKQKSAIPNSTVFNIHKPKALPGVHSPFKAYYRHRFFSKVTNLPASGDYFYIDKDKDEPEYIIRLKNGYLSDSFEIGKEFSKIECLPAVEYIDNSYIEHWQMGVLHCDFEAAIINKKENICEYWLFGELKDPDKQTTFDFDEIPEDYL